MERIRSALDARRGGGYRSSRKYDTGRRTILVLIGVILVTMALLVRSQWSATERRSETAEIQIVSLSPQVLSAYEQSPSGIWIRYTYLVQGTAYPGNDFREWTDVEAHSPKVCFAPTNPRDHVLVEGSVRCGTQ